MSDHKHGEMDTKVQEDTFDGFISFMTKSTVVIIVALVVMALLGA